MQIKGDKFSISYDSDTATVKCSGFLDLRGKEEYKEIASLFENVVNQASSPDIFLDIRELEFLNSSGITTLGGFVIKLRDKGGYRLTILCSNKHSWQPRSMKGLNKLSPNNMTLQFE